MLLNAAAGLCKLNYELEDQTLQLIKKLELLMQTLMVAGESCKYLCIMLYGVIILNKSDFKYFLWYKETKNYF